MREINVLPETHQAVLTTLAILSQPAEPGAIKRLTDFFAEYAPHFLSAPLPTEKIKKICGNLKSLGLIDNSGLIDSRPKDTQLQKIKSEDDKQIALEAISQLRGQPADSSHKDAQLLNTCSLLNLAIWTNSPSILEDWITYEEQTEKNFVVSLAIESVARERGFIQSCERLNLETIDRFPKNLQKVLKTFFYHSMVFGQFPIQDKLHNDWLEYPSDFREIPKGLIHFATLNHAPQFLAELPPREKSVLPFLELHRGNWQESLKQLVILRKVLRRGYLIRTLPLPGVEGILLILLEIREKPEKMQSLMKPFLSILNDLELKKTQGYFIAAEIGTYLSAYRGYSKWQMRYHKGTSILAQGFLAVIGCLSLYQGKVNLSESHYGAEQSVNAFKTILQKLQDFGLNWLAKEIYHGLKNLHFPEFTPEQANEFDPIPSVFFKGEVLEEPWKIAIEAFKDSIGFENSGQIRTKNVSKVERLIWKIDAGGYNLRAYLQKQNHEGWAKTRKINLSSIEKDGLPDCASPIDHQIFKNLAFGNSWNERQEPRFKDPCDYFDELKSHPLVFCEGIEDIPISFEEIKPQIAVLTTSGYFKLEISEEYHSILEQGFCFEPKEGDPSSLVFYKIQKNASKPKNFR